MAHGTHYVSGNRNKLTCNFPRNLVHMPKLGLSNVWNDMPHTPLVKLQRLEGMSASDGWRRYFKSTCRLANETRGVCLTSKTPSWSITQQKTHVMWLIISYQLRTWKITKRQAHHWKHLRRAFFHFPTRNEGIGTASLSLYSVCKRL